MNDLSNILLCLLTAFLLTSFSLPSIIVVAKEKKLFDIPGDRSSHVVRTPSLGGIGIFAGILLALLLWAPQIVGSSLQYILSSFLIIFLIGVKDDLLPLSPWAKLLGQMIAAAILVLQAGIELTSLYGLMGYSDTLPRLLSVLLSVFTILVIINAFNLIDGIDGLAGSSVMIISIFFGAWFFLNGFHLYALIAAGTIGALLAFLKFNLSPAKIFMGDTGSLLLGMVSAILAMRFIELNDSLPQGAKFRLNGSPVIAIGVLFLPLFDTVRVFSTRIMRGSSPFKPDRRHIHHLILDSGRNHLQATRILIGIQLSVTVFVLWAQSFLDMHLIILVLLITGAIGTYWLHKRNLRQQPSSIT